MGTRGITQCEAATIESESHNNLVRIDVVSPEEVHRLVDLGKIGVAVDHCSNIFIR